MGSRSGWPRTHNSSSAVSQELRLQERVAIFNKYKSFQQSGPMPWFKCFSGLFVKDDGSPGLGDVSLIAVRN